jgi:hypothetical protein
VGLVLSHSGNSGDIVFSIPTINHLAQRHGEQATVYIKALKYAEPYPDQYEFVRDLLIQQPGIKEVLPYTPPDDDWSYFKWKGIKPDYDLDEARHQRNRGRIHIIKRYFDQFGINEDHTKPFLKIDQINKRYEKYALIHLTERWNGYQYDWKRIYDEARERHSKVYFIGFECEYVDFHVRYADIEYVPTIDLLDMARLIRDCEALYCNQGVALTLAVGIGKKYYLARNGYKTNCCLYTENETLFDENYFIKDHTIWQPDSHLKKGV